MNISTSDKAAIQPYLKRLFIPEVESHKGQNGRVLIIGGSSLFHAASIWPAEVASHFVDIVHYSSTVENNQIFTEIKKKFRNGIAVAQASIPDYVREDDAILIGPGMIRADKPTADSAKQLSYQEILALPDEGLYGHYLTQYLIAQFPDKQFIFDAGALQMMDRSWLNRLSRPAIITPHQLEFERLFGIPVREKSLNEKTKIVQQTAHIYKCIIMLKAIDDIISNGKEIVVVSGGNQGLTKGGTGDILGGLTVSFAAKTDPFVSAVLASVVLKKTAEDLFDTHGYWYNNQDLIKKTPTTLKNLIYNT